MQFESWWHRLQEEIEHVDSKDQCAAPRFNVFQVLRIERREVVTHSRFLASLLDPSGTHGQGKLFLRAFLGHPDLAGFCAGAEAKTWTVAVEESHGEHGRFDMVLRCPEMRLVIVIENKVDAVEREKQCSDYADWIEDVAKPHGWNGLLIYLTPDCRAAESMHGRDGEYVRLGYEEVADRLDSALHDEVPGRLETVVRQYTQTARVIVPGGGERFRVMKDDELIHFLSRPENLGAAFRVAQVMDSLRKELLRQFFQGVLAGVREEYPDFEQRWEEHEPDTTPSDPMLCLYQRKRVDQLGVAAQFWRDQLFTGLCWRDPRSPDDYLPAAAEPARDRAAAVLGDPEEPSDYWLAHTTENMTVEHACTSAASKDEQAEALGRKLASLMRATEAQMRQANDALVGVGEP